MSAAVKNGGNLILQLFFQLYWWWWGRSAIGDVVGIMGF